MGPSFEVDSSTPPPTRSPQPGSQQGDTARAQRAYQDILTLWKDADPGIPILVAAKSEYAKLQ